MLGIAENVGSFVKVDTATLSVEAEVNVFPFVKLEAVPEAELLG
jgi:hypothetical protein